MPFITEDRHAELLKIEQTLKVISSASPKMEGAGTGACRSCAMCLTLIDEARAALNYVSWPEIPHTKVKS